MQRKLVLLYVYTKRRASGVATRKRPCDTARLTGNPQRRRRMRQDFVAQCIH